MYQTNGEKTLQLRDLALGLEMLIATVTSAQDGGVLI
jgi:hypothetical protein